MPAITIGKTMDRNDPVFKPDRNFICWECFIVYPEFTVVDKCPEFDRDLVFINSDILIRLAKNTRPAPHLVLHVSVKLMTKRFAQNIVDIEFSPECPFDSFFNIQLLRLIQFSVGGDCFDQ